MNCVKCGKSFQDDAVFCPYCGKKQAILPKKKDRRANKTGSVYYDSRSKKWIAQIVTGKHYTEDMKVRFQYKRKSFAKRTDALKAVIEMDAKKEEKPAFTLSYYYHAFTNGKGSNLSHDKQVGYKIAYNRLKPLQSREMKDITINDLQAIIQGVETYYPARDVRTLLKKLFILAHADNREINPVLPTLLELPPLEESQVEPLTEEEQLQLWFSYESGKQNAAIPLIMIYTGLMTGEIRKLTKDMIRLDDREIVSQVGLKTKERKKKAVLLPDDIIPVLEDVIAKAKTDKLFPMCEQKFYNVYYEAMEEAGITRHLTPYSCRHTTATVLAVHENVAPQTLQRVMRWKSTRMMDRYVTPSDQDARKAVNKI